MCHPGRPGPQGESQVGSPGLADFHRAKSEGLRLRLSSATRSPALLSSYMHQLHLGQCAQPSHMSGLAEGMSHMCNSMYRFNASRWT